MSLFNKLLKEGDAKAAASELEAKLNAKRDGILEFAQSEIKKTLLKEPKAGEEGAK